MNIDHLDLLIAQGQPPPEPQCQCVVVGYCPRYLDSTRCTIPSHQKGGKK